MVVQDLEFWAREAGAVKERRRIRRAIARALKELHDQSDAMACICKFEGMVGRKPPCATCRNVAALDAINAATRAPKRRSRNAS